MIANFKIISTVGKAIYPSLLWNFNIKEKLIYLTFDDGPIPVITPWVLNELRDYNAKATFFCIGDNVVRNPEVFKMILKDGHSVGNHSYNHLNGWKTDKETYVGNVLKAETIIQNLSTLKNKTNLITTQYRKLYRPPYGRITFSQVKDLEKNNFKIVMWDVISGDYNGDKTHHSCLRDIIKYTRPGSILVFHDSNKAFRNLQKVLPEVLSYYTEKGFEFRTI